MRALAHPVRLRLLEELTLRGPLTATQCADHVGESPSSCSFHLRMLAKYGFIEEAEGGTGRQRPWRVVTIGNRWETTSETPAATRRAGEALLAAVRDRDRQLLEQYVASSEEFDDAWRRAAFNSNYGGWLTAEELAELGERVTELWQPYLTRMTDPTSRPAGARLVHMSVYGFPRADFLDEPPRDEAGDRPDDGDPTHHPTGDHDA
jgi:DNA-binding transcriptional ArsR family regulator